MRVRCGRKWNSLFDRELDDCVARIEFIHWFAPAGGGKLDREIARANKIQGLVNDRSDVATWTMTVNLDEIEVRQAIRQPGRGDFAHTLKIIFVDFVDAAPDKLPRAVRQAVEHLFGIIEVMDRAENEIEFVPIFLDPISTGGRGLRIVVKLDTGANLHIRVRRAQFLELVKINTLMKTIVISEGNVLQFAGARAVDPRLQKFLRIRLHPMSLRVHVVVREESIVDR